MSTRPGWYPDPSSRFPKRWYDGHDWTASVLDRHGQQSYDQLPPAGAPAVARLPAAAPSAPPPPPGAQQQPVTTASLGLTPPPVVRMTSGALTTPVVYGLVGIAVACLVLSMFVLDWYSEAGQSVGFRDFADGSIPSSAPFLDQLTFWNFKWLGFVIAGVALLSVFVFVVARAGSHHVGHVLAAIGATGGALVSTLAIVRLFRTDAFNPDFGAWLLPAGYLVLLVAIVISARNEPA